MKFNPIKIIVALAVFSAWVFLAFILMGCASVDKVGEKEGWFPNGMSEDAQDYPTKYNMMDSQDGSRNPNAQVNVFGVQY